jgi:hypothetical protein
MRGTMRRRVQVAGLLCATGILVPLDAAYADVTVVQKLTGKGPSESTTRIKGNKMRIDQTSGNDSTAILMDLDTQQMIMLDVKKKEAVIMPVAVINETMSKIASPASIKTKVTPTGEKKQVAGYNCAVYDVGIALPFLAAEGGQAVMTLTMNGPACLSKEVPGYGDFVRLYKTAAEKGFIFGDPRMAKGPAASQVKGMTELQKTIAEAGVPIEQTTTTNLEGGGPMGGLMNRMVKGTTTSTLVKIEEGPLADDLFVVPPDYKVKKP